MTDVYNPFSLLNAFASLVIRDYWFSSGTPSYLIRLLSHTDENLLVQQRYAVLPDKVVVAYRREP